MEGFGNFIEGWDDIGSEGWGLVEGWDLIESDGFYAGRDLNPISI